MSFVPRRSAYRASDRVTEDKVRAAAAAAPPPACEAERAVTAAETERVQAQHDAGMRLGPQPRSQPQPQPEQVRVQLAQVPRGEGTLATWDHGARRARGGFRRGRDHRRLRELAELAPTAAAADWAALPHMLCESSAGEGGAAPRTWLWPGRAGPPGQRRRASIVPPAAPPSREPSAAGYAANRSSVQSGSVWSDLFSPEERVYLAIRGAGAEAHYALCPMLLRCWAGR